MRTYKFLIILILLIGVGFSFAQPAFREAWNYTFPFAIDNRDSNWEQTLAFGRNETEAAMIDGRTGKLLWRFKYLEKFGVKEIASRAWRYDEHLMMFGIAATKKMPATVFFVDDQTGEVLWKTDQYGGYEGLKPKFELTATHLNGVLAIKAGEAVTYLDARTGKEISANQATTQMAKVVSDKPLLAFPLSGENNYREQVEENGYVVKGIYKPQKYVMLGNPWKPGIVMDIECAGKANWQKTVYGETDTPNLCEDKSYFPIIGDFFVELKILTDKIFVLYQGITVLDLKTGTTLWETTFYNADVEYGRGKAKQSLGRSGAPLVNESGVYFADFSNDQYVLRKLDHQTGKELWRTPSFGKETIIPSLSLDGNVLLAQFGGRLLKQSFEGVSGESQTCSTEPDWSGPFALKAFDASSGKLIWETTTMKSLPATFSKRITNVLAVNGLAIVANENSLFGFEAATGALKYYVPLGKSKIGESIRIAQRGNNILVFAEEGVASIQAVDGKLVYATPTGGNYGTFSVGEAFFMWTGPKADDLSEFVRIDLETGAVLGKQEDTRIPFFTPDGQLLMRYNGSKYSQYHTK